MFQIKRIISITLCLVLIGSLCGCSGGKNSLKVFDSENKLFATVKSDRKVRKDDNHAYLQLVVDEAVKIISETKQISEDAAKKEVYKGGYSVYTAFDKEMNQKLSTECSKYDEETQVAVTITNLKAQICAVYSTKDKKINYATQQCPPCSAFKPLSVYAPALDNGNINWSSRYEDSPYTYLKSVEGVMRPWPYNANRVFSKRYVYIHQAIMESLNTIAVKCLSDYGVENSVKFLEENFNVPLEAEKKIVKNSDYEQIIGNLSLGALVDGVSTVNMAGYYQIFANGGKYQAPKTILKITDKSGKEIYKSEYAPKQVIKATTADIMNRMLQYVVSEDGTGAKAKCEKVAVAGKTGTDDNNENNWFVGVTPEYSCAFWHGYSSKNVAAEIFSTAMNSIYSEKNSFRKDFLYTAGTTQVAYCTESGKLFKAGCSLINMGHYTVDNVPGLCDRH